MRDALWRAGTGLIPYCVFCPTQYENLVWGFQIQFVLTAAMATLSIVGLLLYRRTSCVSFLIICIAGRDRRDVVTGEWHVAMASLNRRGGSVCG